MLPSENPTRQHSLIHPIDTSMGVTHLIITGVTRPQNRKCRDKYGHSER